MPKASWNIITRTITICGIAFIIKNKITHTMDNQVNHIQNMFWNESMHIKHIKTYLKYTNHCSTKTQTQKLATIFFVATRKGFSVILSVQRLIIYTKHIVWNATYAHSIGQTKPTYTHRHLVKQAFEMASYTNKILAHTG